MLFISSIFLQKFLPFLLGANWLAEAICWRKTRWILLLFASLFFYAYWKPIYLPLLLGSIGFNFIAGLCIAHAPDRQRGPLLAVGATCNLLLLGYFKYAGFFLGDVLQLHNHLSAYAAKITLPLGISFFTFTQIAYLSDVRQGRRGAHDLLEYALFVTFFPHLLAGPIIHHADMIPQFQKSARSWPLALQDFAEGAAIAALGAAKKVILADQLAPIVDRVFGQSLVVPPGVVPVSLAGGHAWLGAFAYTFQLYFDFSGYSDMAVGLALMFGVRFPANFNSPYRAANMIEFWRRWHITLSLWLRDYLYIPLGGNRVAPWRRYANVLITMLLGGLWHGARWNFVIWGGLHGLALVINHLFHAVRRGFSPTARGTSNPVGKIVGTALTFSFVVVAWVFFRATTIQSALIILHAMASGLQTPRQLYPAFFNGEGALLLLCACIVFLAPNSNTFGAVLAARKPIGLLAAAIAGAGAAIALWIGYASPAPPAFLYFNF